MKLQATILLFAGALAAADDKQTLRGFFRPNARLALRYSIQKLIKSESGYDVAASRTDAKFAAGDRLQLWLSANCDGYLYLFNRDASGQVRRVFPASGRKTARVRRFSEYLVPREGWLKIDAARGDEELWVLVALDPISDLEGVLIASEATIVKGNSRQALDKYFDSQTAQSKGIFLAGPDDEDASTVVEGPLEGGAILAHKIRIRRKND